MNTGNFLGPRAVRLIAIPLLIIATTVILIELDFLPWRRAWIVPSLITTYVAIELLIPYKKRGGR